MLIGFPRSHQHLREDQIPARRERAAPLAPLQILRGARALPLDAHKNAIGYGEVLPEAREEPSHRRPQVPEPRGRLMFA